MKQFVYVFILIFPLSSYCHELDSFFKDKWKLNETSMKFIEKGEILSEAEVDDKDGQQSFTLKAVGIHPKKCSIALRKISMLEKYEDWLSFIKKSTYQEKQKLFTVRADHTLLPYPMIVHIITKRPTKVGEYDFSFPTGMFAGLKGKYIIRDYNKRCLIYANSYWKGKKTKIPNIVIEYFVEGLTKLGAELLIRKTKF